MNQQETAPKRAAMPDPHLVRHRRFIDLDSVLRYDTVKSWYGSRIGDGRKTALYHFAAYHRWRAPRGLPNDPDAWISGCVDGTNKTLIEHLKALKLWIEGDDFEGRDYDTRSKYYTDIRSFYPHHLVPLPKSKLNVKREDETKVETEVTATDFLKMTQKVLEGGRTEHVADQFRLYQPRHGIIALQLTPAPVLRKGAEERL